MYFLNKFCCICMNKSDLKYMFDVDNDGVSYYHKLTSSIAEMQFKELNHQRLICGECCVTLNTVYTFRQTCLRSKTNLITYISQLQTSSLVSGTMKIKKEIEIKCENEDDNYGDISTSHCLLKIKSDPDEIYARNKCSICLCNKSDLNHLLNVDNDGVLHYNKLTLSIAEMHFQEMNDQSLICGECCVTLNTVYTFRQTCLRSKTNLRTYISQLQSFGKVSGILSVRLTDIKHNLLSVKKEIEIKCEHEGRLMENNQQHEFQTVCYEDLRRRSYEDHIQFPASVKEECESEEDEEATIDIPYTEYTKIGIKEDPLAVVKEEPMSDSETPQDGSTSQTDAGILKREETTVGTKCTQKVAIHWCKICKQSFNNKDNFNYHMQMHSGKRLYECELCRKDFRSQRYLDNHMKLHTGERPHECELCHKNYTHKKQLTAHMKTHGDRSYECEICKKGFTTKVYLTAHIKTHSVQGGPYKCEVCRKVFTWKKSFEYHMKLHSAERSYECEICHEHFILKNYLTVHLRTHDDKPYECEICRKRFSWKKSLDNHMKVHSGERPYECEICHKNFFHKKYLTVHLRTHVDRSYECEICVKSFTMKTLLDDHMKIHTGERPHECEICGKGFTLKKYLYDHMRTHSGERS